MSELDVRLKLRCRVTRGALKAVHFGEVRKGSQQLL